MYQHSTAIHDVAIIGAGPCGLAIAARLRESAPSALFTDIEHARFWGRKHDKNTVDNEAKKRKPQSCKSKQNCSIIVFDGHSDQWMSSWRSKFKSLRISHLRSPLFFHPDPQDRDGLLAFSHFEKRTHELCEIQNVVGREISKHKQKKRRSGKNFPVQASARHLNLDNRDQNDYFTPSTSLFDSYIDCIVQRYDLNDLVHHTQIVGLSYGIVQESQTKLFVLKTAHGQIHLARTVVLATGPLNIPQIPSSCPVLALPNNNGSAAHVFDSRQALFPPHVAHKHKSQQPTTILVVGGGLTSAQVVDLLLSSCLTCKVYLVVRSKLKVKHFDVDLPWVAKLRNREMAAFWSADTDEERFQMLKNARGGGSITPGYEKVLRSWERRERLKVYTEVEIDTQNSLTRWSEAGKLWNVALKASAPPSNEISATMLEGIDHIIFATSIPPDIKNVSFLESFRRSHPTNDINGLPVLNQDLMWDTDIPLFVTGALAGLRLGPGAGNLAGARLGAERIAWGIEEILTQRGVDSEVDLETLRETVDGRRDSGYASEDQADMARRKGLLDRYRQGLGNRFEGLTLLDS